MLKIVRAHKKEQKRFHEDFIFCKELNASHGSVYVLCFVNQLEK